MTRGKRPIAGVLTLALLGCMQSRELTSPDRAAFLRHDSPYLKAHMRDGSLYVFDSWRVEGAEVHGHGTLWPVDRAGPRTGDFALVLDDVALFETNKPAQVNGPIVAMALITGVSLAMTVLCLSNPKACFGSCPTFYVTDGRSEALMAEGFSESVAPALEALDVDALFRARPAGRELTVRMTNEALETHVVKSVRLLAAPRPPGGRVLATVGGSYVEATALAPARSCQAAEGDCLRAVSALDGSERFSLTDGEDLAAVETVDLELPAGGGRRGLVVGFRQTLLSTFLFYQSLAYMGGRAGEVIAAIERGGEAAAARTRKMLGTLGGIEVLVPGVLGWTRAGTIHEAGPLATNVQALELPAGVRKVRLRMTRGQWRLDWLAVASLSRAALPAPIEAAEPAGPMTTLPGDTRTFTFALPAGDLELFLETRGYYLEWMRDEWLPEEDPALMARMFLDTPGMLRTLAPEFKKLEPRMEEVFWGSRFARP